jgi:hypothetical protein
MGELMNANKGLVENSEGKLLWGVLKRLLCKYCVKKRPVSNTLGTVQW